MARVLVKSFYLPPSPIANEVCKTSKKANDLNCRSYIVGHVLEDYEMSLDRKKIKLRIRFPILRLMGSTVILDWKFEYLPQYQLNENFSSFYNFSV
jgi:hypothetical protein